MCKERQHPHPTPCFRILRPLQRWLNQYVHVLLCPRAVVLHQPPFTPNHVLHEPPFTPLRGLHRPPLTPNHVLHEPPCAPHHALLQPLTVYTKPPFTLTAAYTKTRSTPTTAYTQPPYTHHQLHHTAAYTHHCLHKTTAYTNHRIHQTTAYTNHRLHQTVSLLAPLGIDVWPLPRRPEVHPNHRINIFFLGGCWILSVRLVAFLPDHSPNRRRCMFQWEQHPWQDPQKKKQCLSLMWKWGKGR